MVPLHAPGRMFATTVLLAGLSLSAGGCASSRMAVTSSGAAPGTAVAPQEKRMPAASPAGNPSGEIPLRLGLSAGQSWKSRIVSTSAIRWEVADDKGKVDVKTRTVGIEVVAAHRVAAVRGTAATVEVEESSVRILREGRFIDAPFRQFNPPSKFSFTIDTATGVIDFGAVEKAYADWMAGVRKGPASEILGRTFRADDYVAQLKDIHGKPFTRYIGKAAGKEARTYEEKDFVLPFAGPASSIAPLPVTTSLRLDEAGDAGSPKPGDANTLGIQGTFEGGPVPRGADEEAAQAFAEFGMKVPPGLTRTGEARGNFRSTIDALSGREIRTVRQYYYKTEGKFEGGTIIGDVSGKLQLEPAE